MIFTADKKLKLNAEVEIEGNCVVGGNMMFRDLVFESEAKINPNCRIVSRTISLFNVSSPGKKAT